MTWSISIKFRLTAIRNHAWSSFLQITTNDDASIIGSREPAVYVHPNLAKLQIQIGSNNHWSRGTDRELQINEEAVLVIKRQWQSGTTSKITIIFNGINVYTAIDTTSQNYYNMKVYLGQPWNPPAHAYIEELKIMNFLN